LIKGQYKKTGISAQLLEFLHNLFKDYPGVTAVTLFGSRAKGTYHEGSDIDLVIKGSLQKADLFQLLNKLEESPTLLKIDALFENQITSKDLLDHIGRVGIALYP
jgi:uncharacterized protein